MHNRSARREIETLAEWLRQCLRCVTDQPAALRPSPEKDLLRLAFLPLGSAAQLRTGGQQGRVLLTVQCDIMPGQREVHNPWSRAVIVAYRIDIGHGAISYHWHPVGPSHVQTPHLHVKATRDMAPGATAIEKLHFPTGPVSLAAIVRFLIDEVGIEPNRADWGRVLADAEIAL